jgi:hypothetical protein
LKPWRRRRIGFGPRIFFNVGEYWDGGLSRRMDVKENSPWVPESQGLILPDVVVLYTELNPLQLPLERVMTHET